MTTPYQKAYFLLSVADLHQLPADEGIEVAMAGRSNAGKSSVLNRITQQHSLARVSKTPGRTQMINIFVIDQHRRLVDLPGYGFAKVPIAAKRKWQKTVDAYLGRRESLYGLLLIMDIRHPLKDMDVQLLEYCDEVGLAVHILLNKADKLSKSLAVQTMHQVKAALANHRHAISIQCFSATKGDGMKELLTVLNSWYQQQ